MTSRPHGSYWLVNRELFQLSTEVSKFWVGYPGAGLHPKTRPHPKIQPCWVFISESRFDILEVIEAAYQFKNTLKGVRHLPYEFTKDLSKF